VVFVRARWHVVRLYVQLSTAVFAPLPLVVLIVVFCIWRDPYSSKEEMSPLAWIFLSTQQQLSYSPSHPTFAATFPKFVKVAIQWEVRLRQYRRPPLLHWTTTLARSPLVAADLVNHLAVTCWPAVASKYLQIPSSSRLHSHHPIHHSLLHR